MPYRPPGTVDRTPQPCHHPRAQHQHGTRACYVHDKCKCDPCTLANRAYANQTNRQHVYGRWDNLVDAEPARQHVRTLMAAGMGWKQVMKKTGLSSAVITKLLYGRRRPDGTRRPPSKRIRPDTERVILAVQLELAPHALVSSIGTIRRIRALIALGWTQVELGARLGITPSNFTELPAGRRPMITAATARAVLRLYADLSMQKPPETPGASRARAYARARRWVPPLAWDDDKLDDPAAPKPKRVG